MANFGQTLGVYELWQWLWIVCYWWHFAVFYESNQGPKEVSIYVKVMGLSWAWSALAWIIEFSILGNQQKNKVGNGFVISDKKVETSE